MPPTQRGDDQRLRLLAPLLARDVDLVDGRRLGEGQLAVLLDDEVAPQRDQEEQAEGRAQHRDDEDRQQHGHGARRHVHDVQGRQGEDRPGHDQARSAADALDDDVLEDRVLALEEPRDADGQDADRDRRLHHLRDLESRVGRGDREDEDHDDPEDDRSDGELGHGRPCRHVGLVGLSRLQFPVRRRVQLAAPAPLPFLLPCTHASPPRERITRDATGRRPDIPSRVPADCRADDRRLERSDGRDPLHATAPPASDESAEAGAVPFDPRRKRHVSVAVGLAAEGRGVCGRRRHGRGSTVRVAKVAELADAPDLGSGSRKAMGVRVPPFAFTFAREGATAVRHFSRRLVPIS